MIRFNMMSNSSGKLLENNKHYNDFIARIMPGNNTDLHQTGTLVEGHTPLKDLEINHLYTYEVEGVLTYNILRLSEDLTVTINPLRETEGANFYNIFQDGVITHNSSWFEEDINFTISEEMLVEDFYAIVYQLAEEADNTHNEGYGGNQWAIISDAH